MSRLKKLLPQQLINNLHYIEALTASFAYRMPSRSMITIGIVGSKGKTTLANLLWAALSGDGSKVGLIGTANIRIGQHESLNPYHMTMPGRHHLQKVLADMRQAGCQYAIMEVPSEGQAQWRHIGVHFDTLIFTNVTREIMASHNYSLELLHTHNQRVFRSFAKNNPKKLNGRLQPKILIANADAEHFAHYFAHIADIKRSYSVKTKSDYQATRIQADSDGATFQIHKHTYQIHLPGIVNVSNATGAIAAALELGKAPEAVAQGIAQLQTIPGRMERITEGQPFDIIVDYAHEETGMQALMDGAKLMRKKTGKIITLLGAEGGGRDKIKRPIMGEIAMRGSDYVIISNVDPYSDDPMEIIHDIAKGAEKVGGKKDESYYTIADRRSGIRHALTIARPGDLVLITGKGSEQSIIINGKKSDWDDRAVVREELKKLTTKPS